jgi:hypothetical protein
MKLKLRVRSRLALCFTFAALACAAADTENGKLTVFMGTSQIATETYSITKSDGKIELSGSGNADLGALKIDIQKFQVVTDDKFQPISAEGKAMMGQMKIEHSIQFADGKAKDQVTTAQGTNAKEDDVHADTLVVNANLPLFAWSALALRVKLDTAEPQKFNAYIAGQLEVPVTVVSKGRDTVEFANTKAELNHFSLDFPPGATSAPIHVEVWLNDARKIVKVAVPAQNIEAYQDGFERKAPPPKPEAK